jgi:hypothetical protein
MTGGGHSSISLLADGWAIIVAIKNRKMIGNILVP